MGVALGAHIGQQNMTMEEMRTLWKRFDPVLDWISVWDHFYEAPPASGTLDHFEAMTTLGALAADTSSARLGCLVFYVGYRNPGVIAKAAATLDHISNGRFELGLGAGWHVQEANAYGYDFPSVGTRLDMLDEATTIIRGLLTQDRTTFEGKYYRVENASNVPKPVQSRLPIWIGGRGEKKTLRIAATHADGWNAGYVSAAEFARLNGVFESWCEKLGRDPAGIGRSINLSFNMGMNDKEVAREKERLYESWGPGAARVEPGSLLCTPSEAVDRVQSYIEAGADHVNVALRAPWNAEAMDAYLEEVVPQVRNQN